MPETGQPVAHIGRVLGLAQLQCRLPGFDFDRVLVSLTRPVSHLARSRARARGGFRILEATPMSVQSINGADPAHPRGG